MDTSTVRRIIWRMRSSDWSCQRFVASLYYRVSIFVPRGSFLWAVWLFEYYCWFTLWAHLYAPSAVSMCYCGDLWAPHMNFTHKWYRFLVADHEASCAWLWGASKRVINFPWIFYAMRSLVPVGHFRNISGHLFIWLVCGSFQWRHRLLFTDCIVWDDKDKVIGFKRSHWIHLGKWSTGSPKLFQLSQHSYVTNCRLISSSAYFPWNMTLKYKMQLSEGFWEKKTYILSRGHRGFRRKLFFLAVCLSKRYTKVPEVVFATSL